MESLLPQARYVGEVGLDAGPRFYKSLDIQKVVFERVLKACAAAGDKILTVHSVRATTTVLDLIELHLPMTKGLVVLHWFTGTASEARRAVAMGCYFSINMQMLLDDKRRAIVTAIPLERLLTETDGPFTTTNSLPNRPEDVRSTIRELAAAFDKGESEMRLTIATNLGTVVAFGTCR